MPSEVARSAHLGLLKLLDVAACVVDSGPGDALCHIAATSTRFGRRAATRASVAVLVRPGARRPPRLPVDGEPAAGRMLGVLGMLGLS